MAWTKQTGTRHAQSCTMTFGRKDARCPRCQELIAGSAPREGWGASARQQDEERTRQIRAHFASHKHNSGGCGPVCTAFDW